MQLEETYKSLTSRYSDDRFLIDKLWEEIRSSYSSRNRHYHTLGHLNNILNQIAACKELLSDIDSILFALYYHDAVYNVLKKDNEEKSALLAEKRMKKLNVADLKIGLCKQHIIATKVHADSKDTDTNFFTDADLSILGQPWEVYEIYVGQVRKEYFIYPDLLYKPGRRKVLQRFLQMPKIFKTDFFSLRFEHQARINLEKELSEL